MSYRSTLRRRPARPALRVFTPRLETLEARLAPANSVAAAFSAGTLTLTATTDLVTRANNDNSITVNFTGVGAVSVAGVGATVITGPATNFTGVKNIVMKMGIGNDMVTASGVNITGNFSFYGGDGNDALMIDGPKLGSLTVNNGDGNDSLIGGNLTVIGAATINNGDGNSSTILSSFYGSATHLGSLSITNGDGFDDFSTYYNGMLTITTGNLTVNNNAGGSTTRLGTTSVKGATSIMGLAGEDIVEFGYDFGGGTYFGTFDLHDVTLKTGTGDSSIKFQAGATTIDGGLVITNGEGEYHTANFQGKSFFAKGAVNITRAGGRENTTMMYATDFNKIGSLNVRNGQGYSLFIGQDLTVNGGVDIRNRAGGSETLFTGFARMTKLSVKNGPGYDLFQSDELAVQNADQKLTATNAVKIQNDIGGSGTFFGANTRMGSFLIENEDGYDMLSTSSVGPFEVQTNFEINNGMGHSWTSLAGMKVGGTTKIKNRSGDDTVEVGYGGTGHDQFQAVTINNGQGASYVSFGGVTTTLRSLTVTTGSGNVHDLRVGGTSFEASGPVEVNNGDGETRTQFLAGTQRMDSLTITNGVGADTFESGTLMVARGVTIQNGNGGSSTLFNPFGAATTVLGSLTLENGDGADTFQSGNLTVVNAASIKNGHGGSTTTFNANLAALNQTNLGSLAITNGEGADTFDSIGSTLFGSPLIVAGSVTVANGNGGSSTALSNTSVGRQLRITCDEGTDSVNLGIMGWETVRLGSVAVNTGVGDSTVRFNGATTAVAGLVMVEQENGDTSEFTISGNSFSAGDIIAYVSATTNTVRLEATTLTAGGLTVEAFSGTDQTIQVGASSLGSTTTLGTVFVQVYENDTSNRVEFFGKVAITNKTLPAFVNLSGHRSMNTFNVEGSRFEAAGGLEVNLGEGEFNFDLRADQTILGADSLVTTQPLSGGTIDFGTSMHTTAQTFKGLKVVGGEIRNIIHFHGTNLVSGSLNLSTGEGPDTIESYGNLTVLGAMVVDSGDGDDTVAISGPSAQVNGAVTVRTGAGRDSVTLANFTKIGGPLLLDTGTQNDQVIVSDSAIASMATINTGTGNDLIWLEAKTNNAVQTSFAKSVKIDTGSGDDEMTIGLAADADDRAVFLGIPVSFDGGAGFDVLRYQAGRANVYPVGQPLVLNWENAT